MADSAAMELNHYRRDVNSMSDGASRPKKQRRISRACDFCHRRSIRCRPTQGDGNRCQNCSDFGVNCTFIRPLKRRGTKLNPRPHSQYYDSPSGEHANPLLHPTNPQINQREPSYGTSHESAEPRLKVKFSIDLSEDHQALVLNNLAKIQDLVTVYFEVVYPM
jgi:hypothetical protein